MLHVAQTYIYQSNVWYHILYQMQYNYNRKNEMSIFQKRNEQIFSFSASFFLLLFRPLKHQLKADFKPLKQA